MERMFRAVAVIIAAIGLHISSAAVGQAPKQLELTETHIQGFIAAQKELAETTEKMQGAVSDQLDPKIQAEFESIARKHGFKDFSEYNDVAANISMIMADFDSQTKMFTEPSRAITNEIEEVKADKAIPEKEKKQMLEDLNEALKNATHPACRQHRSHQEALRPDRSSAPVMPG